MQQFDLETQILAAAAQLERQGRYADTRRFVQHGGVTVYRHCVRVAVLSCRLADAFGWQVDRAALIRGALLHDYFLYDWHEKDDSHRLHGFTHPRTALRNACADWTLTDREQNIILRHMFPLTPVPPACREGWLSAWPTSSAPCRRWSPPAPPGCARAAPPPEIQVGS